MTRPISLLICALGGEGGGVLTNWLVDVARRAGYAAQATSVPGVAQRTGATTYYFEVFPLPQAGLGGRRPVFSLNPVPGALDAMISSELLETARQAANGMPSPDRTLVITSTSRSLTTAERMQLGDGRADDGELLGIVRRCSRAQHVFDMNAVAKESGTVVSAVMLGAIAASGLFPFARQAYEDVICEGGATSAQASLRGFSRAFDVCRAGADPGEAPRALSDTAPHREAPTAVTEWPAEVAAFATLGVQRLTDYQGRAYAQLYEQRLRKVLQAERAADPAGANHHGISRETARWLALWMAFDDIVRVAQLKSRAARFRRVRDEVKAKDDDLVRIYDHFKPGAAEFAALLPPSLAAKVAKGQWSLPIKLGAHTVAGMIALRTLASLKWLRPKGSRYQQEQGMIDEWLDGVVAGAQRDWRLGHEVALCGRLIKGYGSTNERGKANLLHVLHHLAPAADAAAAAGAIADARNAALADEGGKALDATLVRHGAPPRPVKEQPLRFVRKPAAAARQ